MLVVVFEQRVREVEDRDHPIVGDAVRDGPVLPARLDEPAPAKTRKIVGQLRPRQAEDAEQALAGVLDDEPAWRDLLFITPVEPGPPLFGLALN